jgi:hypothetical protein
MITDNATIFADKELLPNGAATGVALAGATGPGGTATAPYVIDLLQTGNPIGYNIDSIGTADLEMNVSVTTGFTTTSPVATVEFLLASIPIKPALLTNATTSGKLLSASLTATIGTNSWGAADHGLQLGTPLYFSAVGTVTGVSTNTLYFAVPSDANNFKVATTLANALANSTVTLGGTGAACTTVFMPAIHATTGAIQTVFLKAGSRLLGTSMKQQAVQGGKLVAPYSGAVPLPLGVSVHPSYLAPGTLAGIGGGAGTGLMKSPGRYLGILVVAAGANSDTTGRFSLQVGRNLSNSYTYGPTGLEVR